MSSIGITDANGKRKVYRVKPFEELTIADWRALTVPSIEAEDAASMTIELVSRHCTIPKAVLRKMPYNEVSRLLDAMSANVDRLAKERTKAEQALDITTFTFDGVTYTVPQDVEQDATFGQWEDLNKVLLPKCETDADMHAAICACLCTPQGEAYDGAKVMDRMASFERLPIAIALKVYAFFFANSERFRSDTLRCLSRMMTSRLHSEGQALNDTLSVTARS